MRSCFSLAFGLGLLGTVFSTAAPAEGGKTRPDRITSVVRADPRTGKLIRRVVAESRATPLKAANTRAAADTQAGGGAAASPQGIAQAVEQAAAEHSLPPELIHSVIKVESNYDRYAVSPKGALGLMQLIPSTARRFGVSDVFDPVENIQGGARYLRYLLDMFRGDYTLTLAAYNAGEAAVARYGSVPPFPETKNYVAQVGRRMEAAKAAPTAPAPNADASPEQAAAAVAAPLGPNHIQEIVEADGSVRYVSR